MRPITKSKRFLLYTMYSWDYVLIILQVTLSFVASQKDLTDQLKIIFTDQPKYIVRGSEVHLTCVLTGGNQPHLTWISPLRTLPAKCRTENGGSTLIIPNYEESDNGQYICVASDGQQFANHVFILNMNDHRTSTSTELTTMTTTTSTTMKTTIPTTATPSTPHILSVEIRPSHYQYGDNVQLICTVANTSRDVLGWNMLTDPSQIPSNIHLKYGTNYAIVEIQNFQSQNVARYQCFVHNALGSDARVVTLHSPHIHHK